MQTPIEHLTISCDICACRTAFFIYSPAQERVLEDTLRSYGWRIETTQFGSLEHCPDCVLEMTKTRQYISRDRVGRLVEYLEFEALEEAVQDEQTTQDQHTGRYLDL